MPETKKPLVVRIKKKRDGDAALSCERADGSVTWQRQEGQLGAFFPLHDLTHLAVESVLGFDDAFYGLIASGWDIGDFAGKAKQLPPNALLVEVIVGVLDLERRVGEAVPFDEFNRRIADFFSQKRLPIPAFEADEAQLQQIRARRAELFEKWHAIPPGDTLEVAFE